MEKVAGKPYRALSGYDFAMWSIISVEEDQRR
jgi:hypothetical protein